MADGPKHLLAGGVHIEGNPVVRPRTDGITWCGLNLPVSEIDGGSADCEACLAKVKALLAFKPKIDTEVGRG